jgi:hypothetical protein
MEGIILFQLVFETNGKEKKLFPNKKGGVRVLIQIIQKNINQRRSRDDNQANMEMPMIVLNYLSHILLQYVHFCMSNNS